MSGRTGALRLDQHLPRDLDAAAPTVVTPATSRSDSLISARTWRAGGVSGAKAVRRGGTRSPQCRAGPRSTCIKQMRIESEAEEAGRASGRLERRQIVVCHGDIDALESEFIDGKGAGFAAPEHYWRAS